MFFVFINKKNESRGFSLVEVIISASIVSIVGIALVISTRAFFEMAEKSSSRVRSSIVLNKGIESLRFLRDSGWKENIANLSLGQNYYIIQTENGPEISSFISDSKNYKVFFSLSEVLRDENGHISGLSGQIDEGSRLVNLTVEWERRGVSHNVSTLMMLNNLYEIDEN